MLLATEQIQEYSFKTLLLFGVITLVGIAYLSLWSKYRRSKKKIEEKDIVILQLRTENERIKSVLLERAPKVEEIANLTALLEKKLSLESERKSK